MVGTAWKKTMLCIWKKILCAHSIPLQHSFHTLNLSSLSSPVIFDWVAWFDGVGINQHCLFTELWLNIVINCHCQTCRMDYAFKVFEGMEAHGYIPNVITFITLIKGLCRQGRMKDAVILFSQMGSKQEAPHIFTYNTLIDGLCKTGKTH